MSYSITYTPLAERSIARIPRNVLKRIDEAILSLAENPRPRGCKKLSGHGAIYRVRVGVYRIVYEIDDRRRTVLVLFAAHRREVYRGF